jgi:hypothetical protein
MKFSYSIATKALTLLLVLVSLVAQAQFTNSAYSRYGLGSILQQGNAAFQGMGGLSIPVADINVINTNNPGSYGFLGHTTFQAGVFNQVINTTDGIQNVGYRNGMVNEISMAFKRLGGKWTYVVALSPYSSSGYNVSADVVLNDSLDATYRYTGDGGLNQLTIGTNRSFQFSSRSKSDSTITYHHRLMFGVNANYLFGSIYNTKRVEYGDTRFYNTRITSRTSVNDFMYQAGLTYWLPLSKKTIKGKSERSTFLVPAATYTLGRNIKSKFTEVSELIRGLTGGAEFIADTAFYTPTTRGTITMPSTLGAGLSWVYLNSRGGVLTIGAEIRRQNWSAFASSYDGVFNKQKLSDASQTSFGIEYTPMASDQARTIFGRTTYRMGARKSSSYLFLNGNQISQEAISAGFSMPMLAAKAPGSRFHIGVEYGTNGTTNAGLLKETFLYTYAGITLTPYFMNQWFIVRKYD